MYSMLKFLYVYFLTGHITLYHLDSEDHSFGKNALSHVLLDRLIHPMHHHSRKGWLLVDDTCIKKKKKKEMRSKEAWRMVWVMDMGW